MSPHWLLNASYRSLQRLLPTKFRLEYGAEMGGAVEARLQEQMRNGVRSVVRAWLQEMTDLIRTAARLRMASNSHPVTPGLQRPKGIPMFERLQFDTRLALRSLGRSPGFCGVVILTLALDIGSTTAIFSFVNGILLEPLPFRDPDSVVLVWETDRNTGTQREGASVPDYVDLRSRNRVLDDLAAFSVGPANLTARGQEPQRVIAVAATHNLLGVLGVNPIMGRSFDSAEDTPGGAAVALVSHRFWSGRFDRDPDIVGREILLNDQPCRIIGVLAEGFNYPAPEMDLMVPLQAPADSPRHTHGIRLVGRLLPATGVAQAQENLSSIAAELEETYPSNRARGVFVEPAGEFLRSELRPAVLVLLAAVVTVLLIACGNVAGLLLARGASRRREMAVCAALGAGTAQIIRRYLIEAFLLTGAGTIAGIIVAALTLQLLLQLTPAALLAQFAIELNAPVLIFGIAVSLLIGLGFTLVPLRQVLGFNLQLDLQGGRGATGSGLRLRGRQLLVVAQVSLAMVLLAGASLLLNSFWELQTVDPGFRADRTVRMTLQLPTSRYPRDFSVWPNWDEVQSFNRGLLEKVNALPGVRSAALGTDHPLNAGFTNSFVIVGREAEARNQGELRTRLVTHDYLRTAGIPLMQGRAFEPNDGPDSRPVLMLNESAVRLYFAGLPVLGERVRFWGAEREVVGIVADVRMDGLRQETPPAMYVPLWQAPGAGSTTLLVRSDNDPETLAPALRQAIWSLDPQLAVYDVETMDRTLAASLSRERLTAVLVIVFGLIALVLAAVGLHGLLSYLVLLQRHELGVRMALGASPGDVVRLVLSQGGRLACIGLAIGFVATLVLARLLRVLLYGVGPGDPASYAVAAAVLGVAIIVAAVLPARRAGGVDPSTSLRVG